MYAFLAAVALFAPADWKSEYEAGLAAARTGNWMAARAAFLRADGARHGDVSNGTALPGPIEERREWRDGAPYSPRFLAAYAAYTAARTPGTPDRDGNLAVAATELESLAASRMFGPGAAFLLAEVYGLQGALDKRAQLKQRGFDPKWREDMEIVAPEIAVVIRTGEHRPIVIPAEQLPGNTVRPPTVETPKPVAPVDILPAPINGGVPQRSDKFALLIGNAESRLPDLSVPFAGDDAMAVREELVNYGGYPAANIEIAINATAGQIRAAAQTLASRMPENGTVLVYFTGAGANIGGRDYLAGVDTANATESGTMIAKDELLRMLARPGRPVFAFFQAHRPNVGGRVFGSEISTLGGVAQAQATTAGERVQSVQRSGKTTGVYTDAFVSTMRELRTNQIPITEFGWRIFYRLRDGGATQVPSLPVLSQMPANARF